MSTSPASDNRLPVGFDSFYQDHYEPLVGFLINSEPKVASQSEDIAQDCFKLVYMKWNQVESEKRRSYLYTAATRKAKDKRKLKEGQNVRFDPQDEEMEPRSAHTSHDAYIYLEDELVAREIISDLPTRQREVALLCGCYGFKQSEVAEILEIGVESVKTAWKEAKKKLRDRREEDR